MGVQARKAEMRRVGKSGGFLRGNWNKGTRYYFYLFNGFYSYAFICCFLTLMLFMALSIGITKQIR